MKDKDVALTESLGGGMMFRVTGIVTGLDEPTVRATLPEYVPGESPTGLSEMQRFAGVSPADGLTCSHVSPDPESKTFWPLGLLFRTKHTCVGDPIPI